MDHLCRCKKCLDFIREVAREVAERILEEEEWSSEDMSDDEDTKGEPEGWDILERSGFLINSKTKSSKNSNGRASKTGDSS